MACFIVAGGRQRGWFPRRCANKVKQQDCDNGDVSSVNSDNQPCHKKDV